MIYDVTVIGGGPSGATAAQELATKGSYYKKKVETIDKLKKIKSSLLDMIEDL